MVSINLPVLSYRHRQIFMEHSIMSNYEKFHEWLNECPAEWFRVDDQYGNPTYKFHIEEETDEP